MTGRRCAWCGRAFLPHATGGKPQTFCRSACRRAFDAAERGWVAEAIAGGMLTVNALPNSAAATRALLPETGSPAPESEAEKPAIAAPAGNLGEAEDMLGARRPIDRGGAAAAVLEDRMTVKVGKPCWQGPDGLGFTGTPSPWLWRDPPIPGTTPVSLRSMVAEGDRLKNFRRRRQANG